MLNCDLLALISFPFFGTTDHHSERSSFVYSTKKTDNTRNGIVLLHLFRLNNCCNGQKFQSRPSHVCARDSHALFVDHRKLLRRASLNNTKNLLHMTELNVVPINQQQRINHIQHVLIPLWRLIQSLEKLEWMLHSELSNHQLHH